MATESASRVLPKLRRHSLNQKLMLSNFKNKLYFPIAFYFRFFAGIRLKRWKPRIVVVTGSSGKTTLLHLLESQLGKQAKYSHHANSSYGIPFDILDLHRKELRTSEWFNFILKAPLHAFKKPPKESLYIVEADTDRSGEGKFLAEFLKPEVVLWVSVGVTHAANFDQLALPPRGSPSGHPRGVSSVEEAIAYDFGYFVEYCTKLAVVNGDLLLEMKEVERAKATVKIIKKSDALDDYKVEKTKTMFTINGKKYAFEALLPEEVFYAIAMCREAVEYFDLPFDASFKNFVLPPGRGSMFAGIKNTTIIDSSYNANLSSVEATLGMFEKFPAQKKWVVLGDMLELGEKEKEEHEKLGEILSGIDLERIILVGKRVSKYTYPSLRAKRGNPVIDEIASSFSTPRNDVVCFEKQKDALEYLKENVVGGEAILFKGSQSLFLEGIIEKLLDDKKDAAKLPRRGEFWEEKRERIYE